MTSGNIAVNAVATGAKSRSTSPAANGNVTETGGTLSTTGFVDDRFRDRHDVETRANMVGSFNATNTSGASGNGAVERKYGQSADGHGHQAETGCGSR